MTSLGLTIHINKKKINAYLTNESYGTPLESASKFKMMQGTAVYDNVPLTQVDFESKTLNVYVLESITGFAKQLQNLIKNRASELGYNIVNII